MNKLIRWLLASIILIAVIIWIEKDIGWQSVFSAWQNVSVTLLISLTALTFISYLLRAYRVYYYFGKTENHPFLSYVRINFLHNALNNFLPMRLGEASFPLFMKQSFNYPILKSSAGLFLIRLMDLHWLLLLLSIMAAIQFGVIYLSLSLAIIISPFILLWLSLHFNRVLPAKIKQKIEPLKQYTPHSAQFCLTVYVMTAIIWSIKLAALTLIMLAFIDIPGMQGLFAVISADLSSVLPIHGLAGSGTFEAAVLAALIPLGVAKDAILLAAVNLHIYVLVVTLLSVPLALVLPKTQQMAENN
ncbi:flippase-like domain-containing protein [Catenovulum sp. 2E275]|uniref:lysylphosphatidylglycerol synthase transmembrane domain-containing protein n=1 Tax=Catenovulum sp. 2E275 TaxID=2980497 RepID=UPI0021CFB1DE|nr:lysylphosphatidylglycerol synthase transmembrane domain-containing protein [Catenovulum sp. 2E275]MCU4676684.1 flippase-like domain-containing protein [Catenovulum sp. 2E275]